MICKRCGSEMRRTPVYRYFGDDLTVQPGYECYKCGMLFVNDEWEDSRADPLDRDDPDGVADDEPPPDVYGGHVGFYAEADGEQFHVLGDPNMSEETLNALRNVVRAAKRAIERGDFDKNQED